MRYPIALVLLLALAACGPVTESTDRKQARATEQMTAQANAEVGMPGISNFTERRFAREILERRDETFTTWSYIVAMDGTLRPFCESVGYGLPYAVQYVSPDKYGGGSSQGGYYTLPQAEPNGLFMPDALSATWVMCVHDGEPTPVYVEPEIVVSPFPLQ